MDLFGGSTGASGAESWGGGVGLGRLCEETVAQVSEEPHLCFRKWKLALQRGGEAAVGTRRLRTRTRCF